MLRPDGDSEPFYGVAQIGHVPSESRLRGPEFARIVRACSRGIQVQAEMTARIGLSLHHQVAPGGVGVLVVLVEDSDTGTREPQQRRHPDRLTATAPVVTC